MTNKLTSIVHQVSQQGSVIRAQIDIDLEALQGYVGNPNGGDQFIEYLQRYFEGVATDVVEVGQILMEEWEEGTVKWFDDSKGYGFIRSSNRQDVFVHFSQIESDATYKTLQQGDCVQFKRQFKQRVGKGTFEAVAVRKTAIDVEDKV